MTNTVTRTYDSYEDATSVVNQLKGSGINPDDISVIAHDEHHKSSELQSDSMEGAETGAGTGAGIGGLVGGGAGLLAGLGMMAIPGIGPLVAAGWLATTAAGAVAGAAAGAATGGVIGAMTDSGIPEDEAHTYAEAVRRGSILVSARVAEAGETRVVEIMDRYNPNDLKVRKSWWESDGWTGYDADARPYSRAEARADQARYL